MRLGVRFLASLRASRIQGSVAVSCGIGRRCGLDLVLLWLWLAAIASIRPLAWEPSYATRAALKKTKNKNNKKTRKKTLEQTISQRRSERTEKIFGKEVKGCKQLNYKWGSSPLWCKGIGAISTVPGQDPRPARWVKGPRARSPEASFPLTKSPCYS